MRLKHQGEILPKVTGAMDSCRLLQVSHEKELLIERLKYETSLGHRRKKTMPWRSEPVLRYVQKAPDDIRWKIDRNEFDELLATKERIRSRSRWGSVKSLQACWRVGLSIPLQCAQTCD